MQRKTSAAVTKARQAELERCAADCAYWLNTYGKTYDPRLLHPLVPFALFPRQVEFLRWLQEREAAEEDGLADKSRDVGFTWLCGAHALHGWLFRSGFSCGFGSRKLELVDKIGDPDSIFEKIRILLRNLPEWMRPAGFKEANHDNFCRLINPANGATITGEGGDDIGRGGRKSIYFVDEAAFLEHPAKVEASLSQTTRCRIWVSTPNGPGNAFAKKRHGGNISVFSFHWKDDPRKNHYEVRDITGAVLERGNGQAPATPAGGYIWYPWYEKEKIRLGDPVVVAQEVDIDYSASIEGICIPAKWVRAAVNLVDKIGYCPLVAPIGGMDVADGGSAKSVLIARRGWLVNEGDITDWSEGNTTQTAWKARDEAEARHITRLNYDCVGVGAGVRGTFSTSEQPLAFTPNAVNGGESPTTAVWPDGKTSKERFLNLRAELWWKLRARFEKAYEWVEQGIEHPVDEMISIPNHAGLISDLSLPLCFTTETGKTKIEAKSEMRKRGVKSPDFADALAYTEAPEEPAYSFGFVDI